VALALAHSTYALFETYLHNLQEKHQVSQKSLVAITTSRRTASPFSTCQEWMFLTELRDTAFSITAHILGIVATDLLDGAKNVGHVRFDVAQCILICPKYEYVAKPFSLGLTLKWGKQPKPLGTIAFNRCPSKRGQLPLPISFDAAILRTNLEVFVVRVLRSTDDCTWVDMFYEMYPYSYTYQVELQFLYRRICDCRYWRRS
jgi:hypothetical protein